MKYKKGLGVANIEEMMKENHLRWFEHVQRQDINELVRKIESWNSIDFKRGREKPKMTLMTGLKWGLNILDL